MTTRRMYVIGDPVANWLCDITKPLKATMDRYQCSYIMVDSVMDELLTKHLPQYIGKVVGPRPLLQNGGMRPSFDFVLVLPFTEARNGPEIEYAYRSGVPVVRLPKEGYQYDHFQR